MSDYISLALDSLSSGLDFVWNDLLDSDTFAFFGVPLSQILIFFTILAFALTLFIRPFLGAVVKAGASDVASRAGSSIGRGISRGVSRGIKSFRNKYGVYGTKWR